MIKTTRHLDANSNTFLNQHTVPSVRNSKRKIPRRVVPSSTAPNHRAFSIPHPQAHAPDGAERWYLHGAHAPPAEAHLQRPVATLSVDSGPVLPGRGCREAPQTPRSRYRRWPSASSIAFYMAYAKLARTPRP